MPELPEVETVTCALRPHLLGRTITRVETFTDKLRYPLTLDGRPEILNRPIEKVWRRGRYCLVDLQGGHTILVHLGMTGSCRVVPADVERVKHEHVVFHLDNDMTWRFKDARKFGDVAIHPIEETGVAPEALSHLGPEPLSDAFSGAYLHRISRSRRTSIKVFIMDNKRVTGVGNIYATEALFRAGVLPSKQAGKLSKPMCAKLVQEIKDVLAEAIAAGGTTISDFETVSGEEGYFFRELQVYGKDGEECPACGKATISRSVLGGRSTFCCPKCQH